jgi:hypothetical protein
MSDIRFQVTSRSRFWWNLCLSRKICFVQIIHNNQHHSRTANWSHERCHRIFIRTAWRRRVRHSISHVWIRRKWRRHSRMQIKKSFVWSEINIKDMIRYHTTTNDNEIIVISTFWKKKKNWKIKIASSQSYLSTFNHATSIINYFSYEYWREIFASFNFSKEYTVSE